MGCTCSLSLQACVTLGRDDDVHAGGTTASLGVVGLLESAGRHRHDAAIAHR